jgi:1-acyl-sn-glycerol-3-phosphate acyltransferase
VSDIGFLLALAAPVAAVGWLSFRLIAICERANEADWGGPWLNRLDGLNRIFCRRYHRLPRKHLMLPARGGVLVASNHVSGLDPLLLIAASRRPLRFMIAREEYEPWWFKWLFRAIGCIPVDRSRDPRKALYAARRALDAGEVVALFPHGKIHLDHLPPIPLRRGAVLLAQMTGAPIVPVRIDGVRGAGHTVPSLWMRSRARLDFRGLLHCQERTPARCLEELSRALQPPDPPVK